ncbi:MAG: hypothetical protein ACJAS1_004186 [Oleiphilaceae bacterium]|jgi:hypothetical protein
MFSMTCMSQLKAEDQSMITLSMEDPEAFFMFLADSIEEHGELITPLDIEELDIDDANKMNSDHEEAIQ